MNPSGRHTRCSACSVWPTGQRPSRLQRAGRYLPESMRHPAKMLPAIAGQAIAAYTRPGELVLDPMCGIGTTLVEAAHLGRPPIGIEYEPRWARLAAANLALAHRQGAPMLPSQVITGDARRVTMLAEQARGKVALVLTSPPYGSYTHGHVHTTRNSGRRGVTKRHHRYSLDRGNLAHHDIDGLIDGFGQILAGCHTMLRPGGTLAITCRPIRVRGELIDLPGAVLDCAGRNGYQLRERIACLLCALREGGLVTRASFFQMHDARQARARGLPVHILAHEDLLVLTRSGRPS